MSIKNLFNTNGPTVSFEIFPPKKDAPLDGVFETIDALKGLNPDFISVTYGAGGSSAGHTIDIASTVQNRYGIDSIAHLTCISSTRNNLEQTIEDLKNKGVKNILALRGDIPEDPHYKNFNPDFLYASELIALLKEKGDFSIGCACYPEGHVESTSKAQDIKNLKKKVDAGADFLISQLFLDNELFYDFREKLEILDINAPVIAGILPVLNIRQIKKITELSGCSIPRKFKRILDRYENNPKALEEAGIAYAIEQIIDLLSWGIDGIHLYTMNRPDAALKIMSGIGIIRNVLNDKTTR